MDIIFACWWYLYYLWRMIEWKDIERNPARQAMMDYLKKADWGAAKLLHKLFSEGTYHDMFGPDAHLYFGYEEGRIIAFISIANRDYFPIDEPGPFICSLYVDPSARGRHVSEKAVRAMEEKLVGMGYGHAYIMTRHHGLYEKYGYGFLYTVIDNMDRTMYVYRRAL